MQYREFPKIPGQPISTLGFGCMRLPTRDGNPAHIDEDASTRLLHQAISAGVNYVDTAYPYHGGQSELFVGRALRGGYRDRVQLASKLPVWLVNAESDWERLLDEQLKKLDVSRIDFYLLHALNAERWEVVRRLGGLKAMERARADGRIGHLGFSFHAPLDVFKAVVDGYDWEFCQIQLNLLDQEYQAGLAGLHYAAARRMGAIVMEPLRGGALATRVPEPVQRIWDRAPVRRSPAEWALRWVWNHPEVVTALSGMNAPEQVEENLRVAASAPAGGMGPGEVAAVEEVRQFYRARMRVPCTTCGYCQPCPSGVAIPDVLSLYNAAAMFDAKTGPAAFYQNMYVRAGAGAEACSECHDCESKCPQSIAIPARLQEAHRFLTTP